MDKRIGTGGSKLKPLERKIPKNPKYEHVQGKTKTGSTVNQVEIMSSQKVAKKRGELFRRIRTSTLVKLLTESTTKESIYKIGEEQNQQDQEENILNLGKQNISKREETKSVARPVSRIYAPTHPGYEYYDKKTSQYEPSVVSEALSVASQFSVITVNTEQLGLTSDSEFLLLDLREADEYEKYHIQEALNYPAPNITRDKITPELFRFKNKPGKLIIIYHQDEKRGIEGAQKMIQKGYENLFLLSGGIEEFLVQNIQLIEGNSIPDPKQFLPQVKKSTSRATTSQSTFGGTRYKRSPSLNK